MFPVHQFDFYPHHRNQMQSPLHPYPSFEAIPPQRRVDPGRSCYQSWPWSSNCGYLCPVRAPGCCERYFPGYCALRSPYAQPPPPYYHGSYTVPQGAYHVDCIPPPRPMMDLPHYEHDKDTHGYYHCCGCPNYPSNREVGKNVKIEEGGPGPHLENKVDESLVPFNFKNFPNALAWFSPNYFKNKEENRSNEPQYENQEDGSNSAKINYQYPLLWFPPNYINDSKSSEPHYEKQEDGSSSVKTSYPYPVLLFPPNYTKNTKDRMSNGPQYEKQGGSSNGSKTCEKSKPTEQRQNFVNGWFPFDMNNLRPSESRLQGQKQLQQEDDILGFPCPVFWMPYKHNERERKDHNRTDIGQEHEQRAPFVFEVCPVMVPEAEDKNKREMGEEIIDHKGSTIMEKNNTQKTIPVKQAEPDDEVKDAEKYKKKNKHSEMLMNSSEAGKSSEDGGKSKCSSPLKSSKLPPVCLRVDPLPRKKNANGSSRSPSPPGGKGKSHGESRQNVKPATSLNAKATSQQDIPSRNAMPEKTKDTEQHKSKIKTIQVSQGTGRQGGNGDSLPDSSHEGVVDGVGDAVEDIAATDVKCKSAAGANNDAAAVEDKPIHFSCQMDGQEKSDTEEIPACKAKESKRINLSEVEAARIIQSAYRGYEVRRWEPLKKLKQIMEVGKKVGELKSSIQAFELSPNILGVDEWKSVIGETVMNLLLKLDTIQGMHPSIRDIRKSVARELVSLQEKIDYLAQKKAETSSQQASTVLFGEDMDVRDDLCIKEGQEEEKQGQENGQPETDPVNKAYPAEACQGDSNPTMDAVANSRYLGITELLMDQGDDPQEPITEATTTETELQKGDPWIDAVTNSGNSEIPEIVMDEDENPQEPITDASSAETESQKSVVFPQVGDQTINPALGGTCSLSKSEASDLRELEELPNGEPIKDTGLQDNLVENETGEDKVPEDEVLIKELPTGVLDENTDMEENNLVKDEAAENEVLMESYLETKELANMPQGVLDDDDDDDDEGSKQFHVESDEDKGTQVEATVDVNAEMTDYGLNMNQAEVNEILGCMVNEDSNVELPKPKAEVFNCAKSEVDGYFTENEIPAVTATTEAKEVAETSEEKVPEHFFMKKESGYKLVGENSHNNSSSTDASRQCGSPMNVQKLLNENFELQASGGAAGADRTFAQTCDSGALEEEISDHTEPVPLEAKESEEKELPPPSPTASQISLESDTCSGSGKKLIEENERLREMMQKLIEAEQEQLTAISNLSARVKDLEKRISKKKRLKVRRNGTSRSLSESSIFPQTPV